MATPMNNSGNGVGSTDPRDLMDNAQVLDRLMLSAERAVPDRLGNERLSWSGIEAENDERIAAAIESLVPLGKQYLTVEAAQADVASGVIPAGGYAYVHSTSDDSLADEYRNDAGTLTATGRSFPGSDYIRRIVSVLMERVSAVNARAMSRDGVKGFAYPILSADGYVVGVKRDGGFYGAHFEVPALTQVPARDVPRYIPVVQSTDGTIGIGFNPVTGLTEILLSDDSIRYIADNLGGVSAYLPLSTMRGDYAVSAVRRSSEFNIAAVQDRGGQQYDGKQRLTGSHDTIVIDRVQPMEFDPSYGQSNAGQGGTTGVLLSARSWPFTALSFDGRSQMQGNNGLVDGATLTDLVPVYDPAGAAAGQYPATMRAFAWAQMQCDNGLPQVGVITASAWQGSQPAASFLPGTNNYTNLMTFAARAKSCAALYGRGIECRYLTFIQGENGANWTADFTTMASAVLPALQAAFGQSTPPKIALWQITGAAPDNGVGQQQLAVSQSRTDVQLVGAMYPFPLGAGETLHLGPLGRMMQGDVQAEFRLQVAKGNAWRPLTMAAASRSGNVVTVSLLLPPGTSAAARDTWTPEVLQDGFVYRDDAGDTAITGVAYSGSQVKLTLAAVPTGANPRIRYGMDNGYATADWYALGGKCCAVSRSVSGYYRQGFNVPKYIQHALIRAQIGVN